MIALLLIYHTPLVSPSNTAAAPVCGFAALHQELKSFIHILKRLSAQRLALAAVGGRVDSLSKREKPKATKMPENAPRTPSRVVS
jgi:hypothetical protein